MANANHALASAPLASQGALPILLSAAVGVTTTVVVNETVAKNLATAINVTAVVSGNALLDNNAAASANVVVTATPLAVIDNPLSGSAVSTVLIDSPLSLTKDFSENLVVVTTISGDAKLAQNLAADVIFTAVSATVLNADKYLLGDIAVTGTVADATIDVAKNNSAAVDVIVTTSPLAIIDNGLSGTSNVIVIAEPSLSLTKVLSENLQVSGTANANLSNDVALFADVIFTAVSATVLNADKYLLGDISVTGAVANATIDISKNNSAAIDVIATTAPNLTLENNSSTAVDVIVTSNVTLSLTKDLTGSESATATISGDAKLDHPLSSTVIFTAVSATVLNADKYLVSDLTVAVGVADATLFIANNSSAAIDVVATVAPNLTLVNNAVASSTATVTTASNLTLVNNAVASINVSAQTAADLTCTVNLSATSAMAVALADVTLFQGNLLSAYLDVTVTTNASASANKDLFCDVSVSAEANSQTIHIVKNLSGDLSVSTDINVGIPLYGQLVVSALAYPLLDVDGNTVDSPGGESVSGFNPPSAVVLIRQSETSDPQTYTVSASLSNDPNVITEIVEVDLDDNPAEVIQYSINGNSVSFDVITPREVYAESSTFLLTKEVFPIYNTNFNYNTRFSAKIKQSRLGNNFYSSKFYIQGGYLCSLKDDGYGNVDLYEWYDTVNSQFVKTVGTIDYGTGYISARDLLITEVQNSRMFFYVESLDSVIPTSDYFSIQNSGIVQTNTIAFPSGETVEISQYEKSSDLVVIWAYIRARSYNVSSPSVTLEEREVTYKIVILPDYDVGKNRLLQMLAEQEG